MVVVDTTGGVVAVAAEVKDTEQLAGVAASDNSITTTEPALAPPVWPVVVDTAQPSLADTLAAPSTPPVKAPRACG